MLRWPSSLDCAISTEGAATGVLVAAPWRRPQRLRLPAAKDCSASSYSDALDARCALGEETAYRPDPQANRSKQTIDDATAAAGVVTSRRPTAAGDVAVAAVVVAAVIVAV